MKINLSELCVSETLSLTWTTPPWLKAPVLLEKIRILWTRRAVRESGEPDRRSRGCGVRILFVSSNENRILSALCPVQMSAPRQAVKAARLTFLPSIQEEVWCSALVEISSTFPLVANRGIEGKPFCPTKTKQTSHRAELAFCHRPWVVWEVVSHHLKLLQMFCFSNKRPQLLNQLYHQHCRRFTAQESL